MDVKQVQFVTSAVLAAVSRLRSVGEWGSLAVQSNATLSGAGASQVQCITHLAVQPLEYAAVRRKGRDKGGKCAGWCLTVL